MSVPRDLDAIIGAWMEEGPDRLPDPTRRAIGVASRTIHQSRRPSWLPWRDTDMSSLFKLVAVGAALLVVILGGAVFIGGGSGPVQPAPTAKPSLSTTPAPSAITPGIDGFASFTSPVYGYTVGFPDGWTYEAATREWQPGDGTARAGEFTDLFGSSIADAGVWVWQRPAGSGADITSHDGLATWVQANSCDDEVVACQTVPVVAVPMCAGKTACHPALVVPLSGNDLDSGNVQAVIADPETGVVTVLSLGRQDDWQGVAKYGGGVQLLKSILTTMDVWPPQPGQVPSP